MDEKVTVLLMLLTFMSFSLALLMAMKSEADKTALAESYSQGFTDGRKHGYSEGYEQGIIKGYEQGYTQAKRDTWEKWGWRIDRNG